jgi:hypothetical protein
VEPLVKHFRQSRLTRWCRTYILEERSQEREVTKNESPRGEVPDLEDLPQDVQQALARARKATEESPPLEELADLQEAMLGLAEMSAVVGRMRLASEQGRESGEEPGQKPG